MASSDNSGDESNEDTWPEEIEIEHAKTLCLFCDKLFKNAEDTYDHCRFVHKFDIGFQKEKESLDCYSYIKMINFMRMKKLTPDQLLHAESSSWELDSYLKPVIEDDPLLMFDIDDCEAPKAVPTNDNIIGGDDGLVHIPAKEYKELLDRLQSTQQRLDEGEKTLEAALEKIIAMRIAAQHFLMNSDEGGNKDEEREDYSYFNTYAHFSIHHEMLQDTVRTESYRKAILNNRPTFENKTVLDVGCGTGILSMFSASAGAKLIIGVDQSEIVYQAIDIVRENELESKITLLKGRIETIELPVEKIDIIVSEWMGYFLYFEAMLDSVIFARDKYLSPNGIMVPNRCTLNIRGFSDLGRHHSLVEFWDDVYGFKMRSMRQDVIREATVEVINEDTIVTSTAVINEVDLMTCNSKAIQFSSPFELAVEEGGKPVVGFVAYFDVYFDLEQKVFFSTSPGSKPTHWKQCAFYLEKPLEKQKGDVISGQISCRRNVKEPRSLLICLEVGGIEHFYDIA